MIIQMVTKLFEDVKAIIDMDNGQLRVRSERHAKPHHEMETKPFFGVWDVKVLKNLSLA